jgi:hypothetical protein
MSTSSEAPPAYNDTTSSTSTAQPSFSNSAHIDPTASHESQNGIPAQSRRSMEDERRPLPDGWVRQYDAMENHQFFVDTTAHPPRSIWHHPYDDAAFINSLPAAERQRLEDLHKAQRAGEDELQQSADLPVRPERPGATTKWGRKLKDKFTKSSHDERDAKRRNREAEERSAYEQHQKMRQAMRQAAITGEPQLFGKDKQGRDIYVEPPGGVRSFAGLGAKSSKLGSRVRPNNKMVFNTSDVFIEPDEGERIAGEDVGYGSGAVGYNPYVNGPYGNSRYSRPLGPYSRPYGYGYGGGLGYGFGGMGMGFPLMMGGGMMMGI